MKYLPRLIILTILFVISNSCGEDTVDLLPPFPTDAAFYNTQEEFQGSVFGIYQKLQDFYRFNGGNNFLHDLYLAPDDNTKASNNSAFANYNQFLNLGASEGEVRRFFTLAYELIGRANITLDNIDVKSDVYEDESLINLHRAESRFLRGLAFFRLWNYFGTAPVITNGFSNISEATEVTNSTGTELLDAAIEDFTFAKAELPASWPAESMGRATAGAAQGFLGKTLLFRGIITQNNADLTAAVTEFQGISGYSLLDDFGDNFDEAMENNSESLFEVQLSENVQENNVWLSVEGFPGNGDTGGYYGLFDGTFRFGAPILRATPGLVGAFDTEDPRIVDTFDPADSSIVKYVNRPSSSGAGPHLHNNSRVMRYADVLLLQAWAIVESGGNLSEAIGLVNQVRTRARNSGETPGAFPADYPTTETDPTVVRNWVLNERRIELAFEEMHRWFDLRLLHLTDRMDLTGYDFGDPGFFYDFQDYEIVFAFPDQEVEATELNQNPGYN